jgi:hypothetical protein
MVSSKLTRIILYLLILSIPFFLFYSCGGIEIFSKEKCKVIAPNYKLLVKFDSSLGSFYNEARIWKNTNDSGYEWTDAIIIDTTIFNTLSKNILSLTNSISQSNILNTCFVFYRNGYLSSDSLVSISDIIGFSMYTRNMVTNKTNHSFFKKLNNKKFIENIELNSEVNGVVTNHIHIIAEKILHLSKNRSTITIPNILTPKDDNEEQTGLDKKFAKKLEEYIEKYP